jgi:hypothetical protein
MITFIKLAALRIFHLPHSHESYGATTQRNQQITNSPDWKEDLQRFSDERARQAISGGHAKQGLSRSTAKPQSNLKPPSLHQGTLTDLKVWWGKALAPYKPREIDLKSFAPPPKKRPNHWTS